MDTIIASCPNYSNMKKIGALLLIVLFFIPFVGADGMMYVEDDYYWKLQSEQQQVASIQYENGIENLLIAIDPGEDLLGTKGIWIFPVPAAPDTITIDVIKGYPYFNGDNIEDSYTNTIYLTSAVMIGYTTFPISLIAGAPFFVIFFLFQTNDLAGGVSSTHGISVYDSVEKMGMTSELITATDSAAVSHYFGEKGFTVPEPAQSSLDEYIGQDYSFVVVYISNTTAYNLEKSGPRGYDGYRSQNMIGSYVEFPTDRMYFPLKPTRVYGDRQIPVLLHVIGHVTPEIYDDIRPGTSVAYYTQEHYQTEEGLEQFFNGRQSITDLDYTRITIETPSNDFSDDLWIDDEEPVGLTCKKIYINYFVAFGILLYILFSMAGSLLAGMIFLREKPIPKRKLLMHGLWNCLTLIGFVYGTKKTFDKASYHKIGLYVLFFYLIFGGFICIYAIVLQDPSVAGNI